MIFEKNKTFLITIILVLVGLLCSLPTLQFYAQVNGMVLAYAGMLFLPLAFYIKKPAYLSMRFALSTLACLGIFILIPSHLILLFGFYCFCFLVMESFLGKLNKLAFILMILASPIAYSLFEVFGFPIRLTLTKWAASILNFSGFDCQSTGNLLEVNGAIFSVDPVCMGLNMVMTSLLGSLILISFLEKKCLQYFTNIGLLLNLIASLAFVILANLFRIVLIVLWKAMPGTTLHEMIGLCSMVAFVFVPLYFLLPIILRYFSKPDSDENVIRPINSQLRNSSIFVLLVGLFIANQVHPNIQKEVLDEQTRSVNLAGYEKEILQFPNDLEVVALKSEQHLIYIKSQYPYRISNHSPLICWQGSGHEIKNERVLEVNQHLVFTAELISENDSYYTAWWYDNGKYKTIGNTDWRWKLMKGEPSFRLVNVSAKDFSQLYMEVEWLLAQDLFEKD